MEALCVPLIFVGFVIFLIAYFIHSFLTSSDKMKIWEKFAGEHGLNITPGFLFSFPKITGIYKSFDYTLQSVTEGDGDSSTTYTVITFELPQPSKYTLHIYQEGFLSKIGKMLGSQDIQTGNRNFDDAFMIKSNTSCMLPELLTSALQRKMLYGPHLINISLSGNKLINKALGTITEEKDLLYLSELLWELAMNICGEKISDSSYDIFPKPLKHDKFPVTIKSDIFNEKLQKKQEHESDFTGDITGSQFFSKEEKLCPSCGCASPAENKYCIDCGREI